MAQKFAAKIEARKQLLLDRSAAVFTLSQQELASLSTAAPATFVRLNPLKADPRAIFEQLSKAGIELATLTWLPTHCYALPDESLKSHALLRELANNGSIFIQNPSSYIPVEMLDPQAGERVLDVCASPGGKTSYIAAKTANMAKLEANDNSFDRLQKLKRVCAKLGVSVDAFHMIKGEAIAKKLQLEHYDKILIDAPCSGEDIRMLSDNLLGGWSPAKVKRLGELQKKILKESWKLLKPKGALVYSTCSQAPEENELVINWFLQHHEEATVAQAPKAVTKYPDYRPALTTWKDSVLRDELSDAVRISPSSACISFFACKFIKR